MLYSEDIDDFYSDFGNGWVPFFAVIGADNIFMYGDNDVLPAMNIVQDAIASFNPMSVVSPISDIENNFWGFNHINITDMFANLSGNPISVSITDNSNPNVASVELVDDLITIIIGSELGSTEITVTGDDGSDETNDDVFEVTALNPNLLSYIYSLEDSPTQTVYPNNLNPYSNSYLDLAWTSLNVIETGELANVNFSVLWESKDYASEGTFRATSPTGTDIELYASTSTTPVQLELNTTDFNEDTMNGEWIIYMVDSYGDGGHQITNGVVTLQAESSEIGMVTGVVTDEIGTPISNAIISVSNISTLSSELGQFSFDLISGNYDFNCDVEGYDIAVTNEDVDTNETTVLNFQMALVAGPYDLTIQYNEDTNEIKLTWAYDTPVDYYKVYRSIDPEEFSNADMFIANTESFSEIASGIKYFYRVTAENSFRGNTK